MENIKPIIGILAEIDTELNARVQYTYVSAIEKSGGLPLLLPNVNETEALERFAYICDGFFFTGGADVNPLRYGEQPKAACGEIQLQRDELEFKVFEKVICTQKPILAICRGAQLVNVALGGTLYQDIPSEINTDISHRQSEPKTSPSHEVRVLDGTPLSELMNKERIKANSFHHQAVKTLGKGLEIMALANDDIIEAFYLSGQRYLRAYQWHPERLCDNDTHNRLIFDDFIKNCLCQNSSSDISQIRRIVHADQQ